MHCEDLVVGSERHTFFAKARHIGQAFVDGQVIGFDGYGFATHDFGIGGVAVFGVVGQIKRTTDQCTTLNQAIGHRNGGATEGFDFEAGRV